MLVMRAESGCAFAWLLQKRCFYRRGAALGASSGWVMRKRKEKSFLRFWLLTGYSLMDFNFIKKLYCDTSL